MSLLLIFGGAFVLLMLAIQTILNAGGRPRQKWQAQLLLAMVPLWLGAWALVPSLIGLGTQSTARERITVPAVWVARSDR